MANFSAMDKYIKQILTEDNTVILPKLGALTVTSIKTGEMMFLSYLNYDDGKLAKFIAEKENITEEEARLKVKTFVDEVKQNLENGGTFKLGNLGHFIHKNDEVTFEDYAINTDAEPETEDQIKIIEVEVPSTTIPSSEVVENVISLEKPEEKPEEIIEPEIGGDSIIESIEIIHPKSLDEILDSATIKEPTIIEEKIPVVEENELVEATPIIKIEEQTVEPIIETTIEEKEAEIVEKVEPKIAFLDVAATATPDPIANRTETKVQVENSYTPKKTPLVSKEVKELAKPSKEATGTVFEKDSKKQEIKAEKPSSGKKKKGAFFWIFIILLGLGFTGGILTFMFYDQVKKYLPFIDRTEIKEQKPVNTDSVDSINQTAEELEAAENERLNSESIVEEPTEAEIPAETAPTETIQKPEQQKPAPVQNDGSIKYYVIIGAFSIQENAERFAKKQGENATVIPQGSMFLVSLNTFDTRKEANNATNNLEKAWILKQ